MGKKLISSTACLLILVACESDQVGTIKVKNDSGHVVQSLKVDVCDSQFEKYELPNQSQVEFKYDANCEGHYTIAVEWDKGAFLNKKLGYVTPHIDSNQTIVVGPHSISIDETKLTDNQ
ncbi:MAG: hypothetical protein IPM37_01145 [Hahellaceae bacterium]|nr:hypothetical protein [Hahellaceae bacterium]